MEYFFENEELREDEERVRLGRLSTADEKLMEGLVSWKRFDFISFSGGDPKTVLNRLGYYSTRPQSPEGERSFHFQHKTVSKVRQTRGPDPQKTYFNVERGDGRRARGLGAHFDRNVETSDRSDGARAIPTTHASKLHQAGFCPYHRREIGLRILGMTQGTASRRQLYIERKSAVETDTGNRVSVGNLPGRHTHQRAAFWTAVEGIERSSGRVQSQIIAELPGTPEITPSMRYEMLLEFTQLFKDGGLPFYAVSHTPDAHSDPRNFHMHLLYHDRPFSDDWPISGQTGYRFAAKKSPLTRHRNWLKTLRQKYAGAVNAVLQRHGLSPLFDPRPYTEMGIKKLPTRHLGVRAAALERKGTATMNGIRNVMVENYTRCAEALAQKVIYMRWLEKQSKVFDEVIAPLISLPRGERQHQARRLLSQYEDLERSQLNLRRGLEREQFELWAQDDAPRRLTLMLRSMKGTASKPVDAPLLGDLEQLQKALTQHASSRLRGVQRMTQELKDANNEAASTFRTSVNEVIALASQTNRRGSPTASERDTSVPKSSDAHDIETFKREVRRLSSKELRKQLLGVRISIRDWHEISSRSPRSARVQDLQALEQRLKILQAETGRRKTTVGRPGRQKSPRSR